MELAAKFRNIRVLIVGDIMLDRYWWGNVNRISPEAPVPVVNLKETTSAPGGAANVAANIAALGAMPMLLGCVGTDSGADELDAALDRSGVPSNNLFRTKDRNTTVKTRVLAHGQQIVRIDQETAEPVSESDGRAILSSFSQLIESADVVAISDYAKGLLSESLLADLIRLANERRTPVIVDPKGRDYSRYRGAMMLTPNRHEAALACNLDDIGKPVVEVAGEKLRTDLDLDAVLITEGEDGMTLFERDKAPAHLQASAREVYDSTGAGDTVIAVLAVSLGAGLGMYEAAALANAAAGLVVEKVGTATVSSEAVAAAYASNSYQAVQ